MAFPSIAKGALKPGNPGPPSTQAPPKTTVLDVQAKLYADKLATLKAGDTSVGGAPAKKSLEFVRHMASVLAASSTAADLSSLKLCFIRDNLAEFTERSRTKENPSGWKNFISIEDNDVASFVSKVYGYYPNKSMKSFLNMTTLQKAKLYPKISLYKVQGSRKTEIKFPTSLSDVTDILSASGRGDYGIKSVDFDFKNQNAFGAGRIVDVRLQIFLTSGNSLTLDRGGFSLSDLILRRGQVDPKVYDSKAYELQMDVGYMQNGGNLDKAIDQNTTSMILNLVEYDLDIMENGVINLSMDYKARIEQDLENRFDYDIFYDPNATANIAKIKELMDLQSAAMADTYVLQTRKLSLESQIAEHELAQADEGFEARFTRNFPLYGVAKAAYSSATGATPAELAASPLFKDMSLAMKKNSLKNTTLGLAASSAGAEALKAQIEEQKEVNKISKYGKLLEILFQEGKIRSAVVPKTNLVIYGPEFEKALQEKIDETAADLGITAAEDLIRATNYMRSQIRTIVKRTGVDSGEMESLDFALVINARAKADNISKTAALLKTDFSKEIHFKGTTSPFDKGGLFNHITDIFKTQADSKPEYTEYEKIYWFHLGDLINLLMENNDITGKLERDKLGFVFGPVNIDVDAGESVSLANIADMPITLEMYQTFFYKNVVEKDIDQYFLHDFVKQAMYQLLVPSFNQKCFGTSTSHPISINSVIVELDRPLEALGLEFSATVSSSPTAAFTRYFMNAGFKESLSKSRMNVKNSSPDNRYSYMMFYSNDGRTGNDWTGNLNKDLGKGIFHFSPGVDRGLVKQVKFRKNKKPGLTTMMVERAFSENKESAQLWAIFDVDLSLIGNTLLKPGMHIYIDPSTVGLGSPQSLASFSRSIGIGGYYLVTSVSNTISDGDWETSVVARWQTSGTGTAGGGGVSVAAVKVPSGEAKKAIGKGSKPASKKKKGKKKKKGESVFDFPTTPEEVKKAQEEAIATAINVYATLEEGEE